jgi:uncharacterized protein (TIGR01777 family)
LAGLFSCPRDAAATLRYYSRVRVLITGASGLIGSALVSALRQAGHDAIPLVRRPAGSGERQWNPARADPDTFAGADAVVHLAGRNIAAGRWTAEAKDQIRTSRVPATANLAMAMAAAEGPRILISASAVGFYGDRGDEVLMEQSPPGSGFLASVTRDWEAATAPAAAGGVRVVLLRTGVVLSAGGGALAKMLPPFRLGLGGRLGSGRQWMSWVALDDAVALIRYALESGSIRGPLNVVAPHPVTNAEFTRELGRVLHRPTMFPVPAFALRLLMGEMAQELLLGSQRVQPAAALAGGFVFRYPELRGALEKETVAGRSSLVAGRHEQ